MSTLVAVSKSEPKKGHLSPAKSLLYVLILVFPFFSIESKILRPDWWVGGLLILTFALTILLRGNFRIDPIGRAVLGLHAAVVLSVVVNFWGWEPEQWMEFFTLWIQLVFASFLYFTLANLKLSSNQLRFMLRLWVGMAVVVSFYGLYQALARNLDWPLAYLPYLNFEVLPSQLQWGLGFAGYVRPSSVLREPTYFGMYLLTPLLITAVLVLLKKDKIWLFKSRLWNFGALFVMLAAFVASFALAAYITLVSLILVAVLLDRSSRLLALRVLLALVLTFCFIVLIFQIKGIPLLNALIVRTQAVASAIVWNQSSIYGVDSSARTRLEEALLAFTTWTHHPIVGVGLNQLQFMGKYYAPEIVRLRIAERGYTHNIWLEVLVQLGVVGLLFFGLIWIQALRMMKAVFHKTNEPIRWLGFAFFYVLLATMIRGLMGGPFTFTLYWFYLGIASMIYNIARSEQHARLG